MTKGNKICKKIEVNKFIDIIKKYSSKQIECTKHTFFRLSENQKKEFNSDSLKEYLVNDVPFLIGRQNNGNYAVFYKFKKNKALRIILDMHDLNKVNIVTFYIIDKNQIPRI